MGFLALVLLAGCLEPPPTRLPDGATRTVEPSAVVWTGRSVGELYRVGEVRAFRLRQGGHDLGHSWGRYVGPVANELGHHRFETRIELILPGRDPIRSEGVVIVDDDGRLVRGHERSDAAEIRFERQGDVLQLRSGRLHDELTYVPERVDTAFWADTAIAHEELMLGSRDLRPGKLSWRVVSLSGGVPIEWEGEVTAGETPGTATIRTSLGETIQVERHRIVRVDVENDRLEVEAVVGKAQWPAWSVAAPVELTYRPPAAATFEIRAVEIPGDDDEPRLLGEVLVPKDGAKRRPGVLFLAGAGLQDRYGFAGPPPVDLGSHAITDALASAGFVVLRYDERGFGDSEPGELSFSGQVGDARRALGTLLVHEAVDPDRILLVGHGEGGWRALMLAGGRKDIVGVALLASPGRRYRDVLLHQGEAALARLPPDLRQRARDTQRMMVDALESGGAPPPELIPQAQWLQQIMKVDHRRLIADVNASLWLAQGAKDFEVDPNLDLEGLRGAARRHRKSVDVTRYDRLDHLFMVEDDVSSPDRYRRPGRRVDARFLEDLVAWARRVTRT